MTFLITIHKCQPFPSELWFEFEFGLPLRKMLYWIRYFFENKIRSRIQMRLFLLNWFVFGFGFSEKIRFGFGNFWKSESDSTSSSLDEDPASSLCRSKIWIRIGIRSFSYIIFGSVIMQNLNRIRVLRFANHKIRRILQIL